MEKWYCTCEAGYKGEIYHCPMHQAAPTMYEALEEIKLLCADSAYRQATKEQIIGGKCFVALALARGEK